MLSPIDMCMHTVPLSIYILYVASSIYYCLWVRKLASLVDDGKVISTAAAGVETSNLVTLCMYVCMCVCIHEVVCSHHMLSKRLLVMYVFVMLYTIYTYIMNR